MEEDIKILEEMKNALWVYFEDFKIDKDTSSTMKKIYEIRKAQVTALENLIKGYRELEEKNKQCIKVLHEKDIYYQNAREFIQDNSIPKSKIKEIRDKAEVMDYYTLPDVIDDLNKLLEV